MKKTEVMDIVRKSMIRTPAGYEWAFVSTPETVEPDKFQISISLVKKA
jgi:hypothetical protein